ncbi:MAG TPA: adenosine deaminase [Terriglobia bacterium]|nr:adenosine deaminase [Terriglobia bacterium]
MMDLEPIDFELDGPGSQLNPFIRHLPKVELHVHLEGSLRPSTLRQLAARNKRETSELEMWIKAREKSKFRYGDFQGFIEAFKFTVMLLEEPKDYGFAAARLFEELASQQVRYVEVTLSAGVVLWRKQPLELVFEAVEQATQEAGKRWGIRTQWIFDAVRQFGVDPAREVLGWARRFRNRGVVAFGIGGDERQGPAELFVDVYREARECGLRRTAHAGETDGPESVLRAVNLLGAERIGHGLAAAADEKVMALLAQRQVPLEVCVTSNVSTGVLERFGSHPLRQLLRAGVPLTLNSDDPGLFDTSLQREMLLAAAHFSLRKDEVVQLCRNAIQFSFLPTGEKNVLTTELETAAGEGDKEKSKVNA